MGIVTRLGAHKLADPDTARGAGETSLYNPLRSQLDWQSAIGDTATVAGENIRAKFDEALDGVVAEIFDLTGIDLSTPAALLEMLLDVPLGILDSTPLGEAVDVLGQFLPFLNGADAGTFNPVDAASSFITSILDPAGLLPLLTGGLLSGGVIPGLDSSIITSGEFPMEMIAGLLDVLDDIPLIGPFVAALTGSDGDLGDLAGWASELLTGNSPLDAFNLYNLIPSNLLGMIPFSIIGDATHENLLTNGGFEGAVSVAGNGIWTYDASNGRTSPGCVSVTANGSEQRLLSNAIPVAEGDKLHHLIYAQWAGLVYTGVPFRTRMVRLLNHDQVGIDNLTSPAGLAGTQGGWAYALAGDYTVPAGCDEVCYELTLNPTATAGTVKFDDGWVYKDNRLQIPWTEDLPDSLQDLLDGAQATLDAVFEGITGAAGLGTLLADVTAALQQIPFINVLGVGGPADIGSTMQETWNQWIGGLVGTPGDGATLPDLFNIGQQISSWASLGRLSWEKAGIRSNKSLFRGFGATSTSNLGLDGMAFNKNTAGNPSKPTVALVSGVALTSWHRVEESIDVGTVGWSGSGTAGITSFFANVWRMNAATGDITCPHHSGNLLGMLSATDADYDYDLPGAPVHFEAGDLIGVELHSIGGTHTVVGDATWKNWDANVFPRRWSSRRVSASTGAPANIAGGSVDYNTTLVPFVSYGVTSGAVPLPREPYVQQFNLAGTVTYPVPDYYNVVRASGVGNGGGGRQGGTYGISGEGGEAGLWADITWTRGVDFAANSTPIITVTIPAKAAGGGDPGTSGGIGANGGNVTITLPATPGHSAQTLTCVGGEGGDALGAGGGNRTGLSPGNHTYGPQFYAGGAAQNTFGGPGSSPGGGGGGGNYVSFQKGGVGGLGGAFLRLDQ